MAIVSLLAGLALLTLGGDLLVRGAVSLAVRLKVSTLVIGMTVVSFATSCPELLVSLNAALKGHSDITFGNVIGSNIANIGLVLGLTGAIFSLPVSRNSLRFDWPMMALSTLIFVGFILFDRRLGLLEGVFFVVLLTAFSSFLIYASRRDNKNNPQDTSSEDEVIRDSPTRTALYLLIGGAALYFGSEWLIEGAVTLARSLSISERVISVSLVSVGTSVPELAASLIAAYKKEQSISLGNLFGSNIFNLLAVLGITSVIYPVEIDDVGLLNVDIWWMVAFVFVLLPMLYLNKRRFFTRWMGAILLVSYGLYTYSIFNP